MDNIDLAGVKLILKQAERVIILWSKIVNKFKVWNAPVLFPSCFFYRYTCTAMKSVSGGCPHLTELSSDLITAGAKGTVGDACLTASVRRNWADSTACVCAVPGHHLSPDHVAGYVQRPSVACTPSPPARDCDHHPLCSPLVDTLFLLVIH